MQKKVTALTNQQSQIWACLRQEGVMHWFFGDAIWGQIPLFCFLLVIISFVQIIHIVEFDCLHIV